MRRSKQICFGFSRAVTFRIALMFATTLCASCTTSSPTVAARLTAKSLSISKDNLIRLAFSADQNLSNIFNLSDPTSQLTPVFICSLDGSRNFAHRHSLKAKAEGIIHTTPRTACRAFNYYADLIFYFTLDDGSQLDLNSYSAFIPLIHQQQSISCKAVITAYGYKPYLTNDLVIPSALMLEALANAATHEAGH